MQPSLLFVDDEPKFLVLADRVLSKEGYRVTTARDSVQALAYVDCVKFSLAVLDIKMYPMSGVEVLKQLKIRNPSTHVVMVTGYPTAENRTECIELGAADYLTKPLDLSELKAVLRQLMAAGNLPA